jgi:dienelactone hydrolase
MAERLVAEDRGRELLPWGRFFPDGTISAEAYLSSPHTQLARYGLFNPRLTLDKVRCPLLIFYGTNEPGVGTPEDLPIIRQTARAAPRVDIQIVAGADHAYTGCEQAVIDLIATWVDTLA